MIFSGIRENFELRIAQFGQESPSSGKTMVSVRFALFRRFRRVVAEIFEPGFHFAIELYQQGVALAIQRLASLNFYPSLRDAIFLDTVFALTAEIDSNAPGQQVSAIMWTAWIDSQAIRGGIALGTGFVGRVVHAFMLSKLFGLLCHSRFENQVIAVRDSKLKRLAENVSDIVIHFRVGAKPVFSLGTF